MSDDKPRFQWSATEIVGIGIDNPERVRKTEDGKTVLMPTTLFPLDHGGVLTAAAKAVGFVEIASTPAISHNEVKERRGVTIKATIKATEEDLLNDDPIFPFTTRPSDVAAEMTEIEDERVLATARGSSGFQVWENEGAYSVPVQFAEEVAAPMIRILAERQGPQLNFQIHPQDSEGCSGPPLIGLPMSMEDLKDTQHINVIAHMLIGQEDREVQITDSATGEVLHTCFSQKNLPVNPKGE